MKRFKIKKSIYCYLFLALSVLLLLISASSNQAYFNRLSIQNVYLYQIRQALSVLFLFAVGYLFLKLIQHRLNGLWVCLMAFPSGICLWCFMSQFLLLGGFTYRLWRVLFLIGAFLLFCYILRVCLQKYASRKTPGADGSFGIWKLQRFELPVLPAIAVITAVACLVSTGYNYVILNYDSYFYFSDYGKAVALMMSYKDDILTDNSFVLTNIGQFLPMVSAYATLWDLDTIFPIQGFLIINVIIAFAACIYRYAIRSFSAKKALCYTIFFTLLLISCSPFLLFTNWVLSNSWIMFYYFLLFYLGLTYDPKHPGLDYALLICGFSAAVTMLRKDGAIIVCFLFICYSLHLSKSIPPQAKHDRMKQSLGLALLFIPSGAYQLFYIYYLKHILYAVTTLSYDTSLLNADTRALLTAAISATFLYLLFFHLIAESLFKKYLPHIITVCMIMVFGLFIFKNRTIFLDFTDAWFRNLAGTAFGFSIFSILLLCCLIILVRPGYDYSVFMLVGYALIILIIYWNKQNLDIGVDNSGLRALYQIIPVFYCVAAVKLIPLFTDKKES